MNRKRRHKNDCSSEVLIDAVSNKNKKDEQDNSTRRVTRGGAADDKNDIPIRKRGRPPKKSKISPKEKSQEILPSPTRSFYKKDMKVDVEHNSTENSIEIDSVNEVQSKSKQTPKPGQKNDDDVATDLVSPTSQNSDNDSLTLTPKTQGSRSSGRVRKMTFKAAEAEDKQKGKTQKLKTPEKKDIVIIQTMLPKDGKMVLESQVFAQKDFLKIKNRPIGSKTISDGEKSTSISKEQRDTSELLKNEVSPKLRSPTKTASDTSDQSLAKTGSDLLGQSPVEVQSPTKLVRPNLSPTKLTNNVSFILADESGKKNVKPSSNIEDVNVTSGKLSSPMSVPSVGNCAQLSTALRVKMVKETKDFGVQAPSRIPGSFKSVALQVNDSSFDPVLDVTPTVTKEANSASDPTDLNSLLSMSESEEKVMGGVSALIKDSLLQINGMRKFVVQDLPSLTNVTCFQTAGKIAVSGTIQGVTRTWTILSNIEHNLNNSGDKKSVRLQWTKQNGVKIVQEFRKSDMTEVPLTPMLNSLKDVKPVTVFVNKAPTSTDDNSEENLVSPQKDNNRTHTETAKESANQDGRREPTVSQPVSLLTGRSVLQTPLKIEGQIGVAVPNQGQGQSGGQGKQPSYTITVASDKRTGREAITVKGVGILDDSQTLAVVKTEAVVGDEEMNEDEDDDVDEVGVAVNDEEEVAVSCDLCFQVFRNKSDLFTHKKQTHSLGDKLEVTQYFVECSTCQQKFRCIVELKKHERRAHSITNLIPKDTTSFVCNVCGKSFAEKRYLQTHLNRHTGIKRFECSVCGWRFFENHKLKHHMETHKNLEDRRLPYQCSICRRQYHNRQSWNDHMNTHTGSKPYKCTVCGASFGHRIGLHRHKSTHEKNCRYKCNYCNRGFKIKHNLTSHMTIHTGVGKHKCEVCQKVFTVSTSLRRHKCQGVESRPEIAESPYTFMCGVCNETFPSLAEAETHSAIHVSVQDMNLQGVQVEEVALDCEIIDGNAEMTTYIVNKDGEHVETVGENLADEAEKLQIAASTLADLSLISQEGEAPASNLITRTDEHNATDVRSVSNVYTVNDGSTVTYVNTVPIVASVASDPIVMSDKSSGQVNSLEINGKEEEVSETQTSTDIIVSTVLETVHTS